MTSEQEPPRRPLRDEGPGGMLPETYEALRAALRASEPPETPTAPQKALEGSQAKVGMPGAASGARSGRRKAPPRVRRPKRPR